MGPWWRLPAALLGLAVVAAVAGLLVAHALEHAAFASPSPVVASSPVRPTGLSTIGAPVTPSTSDPTPPPTSGSPASTRVPPAGEPSFAAAVSADRTYLVDQYGKPFLVRGDSPWSLMTDLSPAQVTTYFTTRASQGFNSAIVSLLGATQNGAPYDDGRTYDGVAPFIGGDVTRWNDAYWQRARAYVRTAYSAGITVFLYPIDGWTPGHSFNPSSTAQCRTYGQMVGAWFHDLPNIAWMVGGDYFPRTNDLAAGSDLDHCMEGMLLGLRDAEAAHVVSIQLGYQRSTSTDNPYWRSKVDWDFVYTYYPSYEEVLAARASSPTMPTILGETFYENEGNSVGGTTGVDGVRQQVLWALTSGVGGDFFGTADWQFLDGWQTRLRSLGATQVNVARNVIAGLRWWELRPDTAHPLVTSDRGTYFTGDAHIDIRTNDYVTASVTTDGQQAVVYIPTARSVTVALDVMAPGRHAWWVDPASGVRSEARGGSVFATPGRNSAGGDDWLLVFE